MSFANAQTGMSGMPEDARLVIPAIPGIPVRSGGA